MDLAYLAGQRPADTLRFLETDMRDGFLHVRQGKTAQKLRTEITGELAQVLDRIKARKARYRADNKVVSLYLVVNEAGLPLTAGALRDRSDKAREASGVQRGVPVPRPARQSWHRQDRGRRRHPPSPEIARAWVGHDHRKVRPAPQGRQGGAHAVIRIAEMDQDCGKQNGPRIAPRPACSGRPRESNSAPTDYESAALTRHELEAQETYCPSRKLFSLSARLG